MNPKPTKAVAKRRRLARKRERRTITLAGGDVAMASVTQGQRPKAEDPRKPALAARVRVFGIGGSDPVEAAKDPMCGSGVGMCIRHIVAPADRATVWATWQRLCTAQHNYRTRILGLSGHPQGSAIAMQSDAIQVDTGHSVDMRTPEERDIAAKRAWVAVTLAYNALPVPQMVWAIRAALSGGMDGMGGDVWVEGKPNARGRVLVQALVVLGS